MLGLTLRDVLAVVLVTSIAVITLLACTAPQTKPPCCMTNVGGPANECQCTVRIER